MVLTLLTGILAFLFFGNNPYEEDAVQASGSSLETESGDGESSGGASEEEEFPGSASEEEESSGSASEEEASSGSASEEEESSDSASEEETSSDSIREDQEFSESEPEESAEETPPPAAEALNIPEELRGVMISAGSDFLTGGDTSASAVAAQIDKALADAKALTMNTIILDTKYNDAVLYKSPGQKQLESNFDCTDYIVTKARELGLFVYATYDVSALTDGQGAYRRVSSVDGDTLDDVALCAGEFVKSYHLDGILLDNYANPSGAGSYAGYLANGGGMGYEAYLRRVPEALLRTAADAVRKNAPGVQVGLLSDAVWENSAANPDGSETEAPYTALGGGNADTRALLMDKVFDAVMVKDYGSTDEKSAPFTAVASWWTKQTEQADAMLYLMHAADKAGTQATGWGSPEQLTKQIIETEKLSGISGSAFNSLKALSADPGGSTNTLVQYMNDQINEQYVLTQLAVSKPSQLTFTTKEQSVTFQGASDPQVEVTINGEKLPTNESGYFTIKEDLKPGENKFVISHKSKTFTYTITREMEVLKEVQPVGSLNVEGGMEVLITALAYQDSSVKAVIGGQTITLSPTENLEDEELRSSGYVLYTGSFTAPSASATATQLGNLVVTASNQGFTKSLTGASVTVNKIAVMGDGAVIQVVADEAETFPVNTLNDTSSAACYPLPKGTIDRTYGNEIVYKNGKNSYSYWKLQSGVRVYANDIKAVGTSMPDNNQISSMSIKSSAQYTSVTLKTAQKVPYSVSYDGAQVVFSFQYTASVPESVTLKNNALFASGDWSGSKLSLKLRKSGGFVGYKAYYDGDDLILRFNNSPGSLSGARIVVDPGHGGNDPGATGFYPGKDEADINYSVATKLVSELKNQGAAVLMATPGSTMATRIAASRAFNPQVLVSVHSNSSEQNSAASGTEVYYFYPFAKQLASNISANVASALGTTNRGGKAGLYYMTRDPQFASVLVELGFVTNEEEYTKMINSSYQSRMAKGIANGISAYLGSVNSGGGAGGTSDDADAPADDNADAPADDNTDSEDAEDVEDIEEPGSSDGLLVSKGVSLDKTSLTLAVDDTAVLKATVKGISSKVNWDSEDEDIVEVSSSGKVTAVGRGTAYVYVSSADGKYEAKCKVTVQSASSGNGLVKSVTISGDSAVEVGNRITLEANVTPSNAKDPGVNWKTSDSDVLAISNKTETDCKFEGVADGTATVTAYAYDDGRASATFTVKVGTGKKKNSASNSSSVKPVDGVTVKEIVIEGKSTLPMDTRQEYTATVTPANAKDPGVDWYTDDTDILEISVDQDSYCKVSGLKAGTAWLYAKAYDKGGAQARFKITVTK